MARRTGKGAPLFRIRRIHDDVLPANREAIEQVQAILRSQFSGLQEEVVAKLPEQLRDRMKQPFRAILFVADDGHGRVRGFALLLHAPDLAAGYLDFISAARPLSGRGIGGALYERVREEAAGLGLLGLFFECLPDDPKLCRDPVALRQNAARLRFYERFGARPIAGTAYETPVTPGGDQPPYLVFDDLGSGRPLRRAEARALVRAVLESKYARLCPPAYVAQVLDSFQDDPVRLRPPRYVKPEEAAGGESPAARARRAAGVPQDIRIALVVNDRHRIHHVRERGYVESPVRIAAIERELARVDLFHRLEARPFAESHVTAVHDRGFVAYLKRMCAAVATDRSLYPYVFPIRNKARPPRELAIRAGYYCIDTFTPLHRNAYPAARRAADCALTAAATLADGRRLAYALVRPPGHHAEAASFGGFCYLNSAAIAAHWLSTLGKVAVLDVDYHHGNGQQDIFYRRPDVLTVSLHGHPRFAYPYFTGFEDETGEGEGRGFNLNLALPEELDGAAYREHLGRALRAVRRFAPRFLVVALGLDPAKGDPTGSWSLLARDFEENGRLIGGLDLPTLVVQEGGYNTRNLGINARHFFVGLWTGAFHRPLPPG